MASFGEWFQAWSAADAAAMRATLATTTKSLRALQRQGEPPSDSEAAEAKRLRAVANALLDHGMAAMSAAR